MKIIFYLFFSLFICFKCFAQESCPICCRSIDDEKTITTQCSHIFHENCLREWFQRKIDCPLCRNNQPIGWENWSYILQDRSRKLIRRSMRNVPYRIVLFTLAAYSVSSYVIFIFGLPQTEIISFAYLMFSSEIYWYMVTAVTIGTLFVNFNFQLVESFILYGSPFNCFSSRSIGTLQTTSLSR